MGLQITYVVLPGVRCQASQDGGLFAPHVTSKPLQFTEVEERDDGLLFRSGNWLLLTPRKGVVVNHYGGGHGWNDWLELPPVANQTGPAGSVVGRCPSHTNIHAGPALYSGWQYHFLSTMARFTTDVAASADGLTV